MEHRLTARSGASFSEGKEKIGRVQHLDAGVNCPQQIRIDAHYAGDSLFVPVSAVSPTVVKARRFWTKFQVGGSFAVRLWSCVSETILVAVDQTGLWGRLNGLSWPRWG
jgi:hypothetical protein